MVAWSWVSVPPACVVTPVADPSQLTAPGVPPGANAVPLTVIVAEAAPAVAEIGEMEKMRGPTKGKFVRTRDQAPRPCVPATRVREASWSLRERTATFGRPAVPRVFQVQTGPEQVPW